jgi:hypothetical protein
MVGKQMNAKAMLEQVPVNTYDFVPEAAHKKGTPESKIKF